MRPLPFLLTALLVAQSFAAAPLEPRPPASRAIAFTFDDGFDPLIEPQAVRENGELLAHLERAGVRAMLFPSGRALRSPEGIALVRDWANAAHAIGNHTWSHRGIDQSSPGLAPFERDIERADSVLRKLPSFERRLRFPYLKEGRDVATRDGFRAWMRAHHYLPAPVSVDASDWYYNSRWRALEQAGRTTDLPRLREAYVAHLWNRASYYDSLAHAMLGRSPKHVLLLHANAINAACLGDVIGHFRAHGWNIVSPAEAFADSLYAMQPAALPAGESIVWALARSRGAEGLRYPGEDSRYERPLLVPLGLHE